MKSSHGHSSKSAMNQWICFVWMATTTTYPPSLTKQWIIASSNLHSATLLCLLQMSKSYSKSLRRMCLCIMEPLRRRGGRLNNSNISTPLHVDIELQRLRLEGRNLLKRCDKLLHNVVEIIASEL